MLPIDKFLKAHNNKQSYPSPSRVGFYGYAFYDDNKSLDYVFVSFKWENTKSHPSYYVMKRYNTMCLHGTSHFLNMSLRYISWDSFFKEIENFKIEVNQKSKTKLPINKYEMEDLVWQAFLKTQDSQLASYIKNMPDIFYKTLNKQLSAAERYDYRIKFVDYMEKNMCSTYHAWCNFISEDFLDNFQSWFYNYILDV
jgi:hypothetical protein